jgi:hypothetical protein
MKNTVKDITFDLDNLNTQLSFNKLETDLFHDFLNSSKNEDGLTLEELNKLRIQRIGKRNIPVPSKPIKEIVTKPVPLENEIKRLQSLPKLSMKELTTIKGELNPVKVLNYKNIPDYVNKNYDKALEYFKNTYTNYKKTIENLKNAYYLKRDPYVFRLQNDLFTQVPGIVKYKDKLMIIYMYEKEFVPFNQDLQKANNFFDNIYPDINLEKMFNEFYSSQIIKQIKLNSNFKPLFKNNLIKIELYKELFKKQTFPKNIIRSAKLEIEKDFHVASEYFKNTSITMGYKDVNSYIKDLYLENADDDDITAVNESKGLSPDTRKILIIITLMFISKKRKTKINKKTSRIILNYFAPYSLEKIQELLLLYRKDIDYFIEPENFIEEFTNINRPDNFSINLLYDILNGIDIGIDKEYLEAINAFNGNIDDLNKLIIQNKDSIKEAINNFTVDGTVVKHFTPDSLHKIESILAYRLFKDNNKYQNAFYYFKDYPEKEMNLIAKAYANEFKKGVREYLISLYDIFIEIDKRYEHAILFFDINSGKINSAKTQFKTYIDNKMKSLPIKLGDIKIKYINPTLKDKIETIFAAEAQTKDDKNRKSGINLAADRLSKESLLYFKTLYPVPNYVQTIDNLLNNINTSRNIQREFSTWSEI